MSVEQKSSDFKPDLGSRVKLTDAKAVERSEKSDRVEEQLGNLANKSSAINSVDRRDLRKARYELRALARKVSLAGVDSIQDAPRVCNCGWATSGASGVGVRVTNGRAGFSGVQNCGSVWACPNCSTRIATKRAQELGEVFAWARREQHTLVMITLTVSHKPNDALTDVWNAVSSGWSAVSSGSSWVSETEEAYKQRLDAWHDKGWWHEQRKFERENGHDVVVPRAPRGWHQNKKPLRRIGDQEQNGVLGWVRATEVTHGENSWHVHNHVVAVLEGNKFSHLRAQQLGDGMRDRWNKGIGKVGFTSSAAHGVRIDVAEGAEQKLADYIAKSIESEAVVRASVEKAGKSLAREATLGQLKKGRLAGRSPFQILADTKNGEARDFALWHEWIRGSHGRRQLTWSSDLRELAGLALEEQTDQNIVDEEIGSEEDTILVLPKPTWVAVRSEAWKVLDLAESGREALIQWLRYKDLDYDEVCAPPRENIPLVS